MTNETKDPAANGLSVLIVDDSQAMRTFVRRVLDLAGLPLQEVQEAEDGRRALEALSAGRFDLVLSDINMPNMNGTEMCRAIRADSRFANVRVIVVSTDSSRQRMELMRAIGADGYLPKPFQPELLKFEVERVMGCGS